MQRCYIAAPLRPWINHVSSLAHEFNDDDDGDDNNEHDKNQGVDG